jgi:hypothetical protein
VTFGTTRNVSGYHGDDLKMASKQRSAGPGKPAELQYLQYANELEKEYLPAIRALLATELSEPYSIYVYRYFLSAWPDLCILVRIKSSRRNL